jgi:hypothetical protein
MPNRGTGKRCLQSGVHVMRKAGLAGHPALGSLEEKGYNAINSTKRIVR